MMYDRYLFRGRTLGKNEWIIGAPWISGDQAIINGVFIDPTTIGQCTGMHDIKDVLIYEGDIVLCDGEPFLVCWNSSCLQFTLINQPSFVVVRGHEFKQTFVYCVLLKEVIGNIYENPELLEVQHG